MMRTVTRFELLIAALLLIAVLAPGPAWAGTGPTSKNCPSEPAQNVKIVSGMTYSGTNCVLSTTGDVDSFQFSASTGNTYRVVLGIVGPAPTNICFNLYAPGVPAKVIATACTGVGQGGGPGVNADQKLTTAGIYTIAVQEEGNASVQYSVSLERLNPAPPEAIALTLAQNVTGAINPPTAQDAYTFDGNTAGTYQITASIAGGFTSNICFDVYRPDGVNVVHGSCTGVYVGGGPSTQQSVTPAVSGTYTVVVYAAGDDGTANYNLEVSCLVGNCNPTKCVLKDALSYSSGTLTMDFTIGTPYAVTWNAWLVSGNTMEPLWSQPQPVTEPPVTSTKMTAIAPSGSVGVLSTLTVKTKGIACSSWSVINTGKP